MSNVGCSVGLTLGGIAGLKSVGGGSVDDTGTSTSEVPSCVQKVSHSSANSWLHLGQRFIVWGSPAILAGLQTNSS
jgi:hypothetical protein